MGRIAVIKNSDFSGNYFDTVAIDGSSVFYNVSISLDGYSISSYNSTVREGSSFSAKLTVSSGYSAGTVLVTMGGTDVTSSVYNSSTGFVSITSVSGNVVITAVAEENESVVNITKVGDWVKGYVQISGNITEYESDINTVWRYQKYSIEVSEASTAYVAGTSLYNSSVSIPAIVLVNESGTVVGYYGTSNSGETPFVNMQITLPVGTYFAYVNTSGAILQDIYLGVSEYSAPTVSSLTLTSTSAGVAYMDGSITASSSVWSHKIYHVEATTRLGAVFSGTGFYNNSTSREVRALQIYDSLGRSFLARGEDSNTSDTSGTNYTNQSISLPIGSYNIYINYYNSAGGSISLT